MTKKEIEEIKMIRDYASWIGKSKHRALKSLQKAGILDSNKKLTPPYRSNNE